MSVTLDKQLSRLAEQCDRVTQNRWRLALTNGRSMLVSVVRDEGFLLFDAAAGFHLTAERLVPLIERSSELPATVKLALPRNSSDVRLRSELPLPEEDEVSEKRIEEHLEGLRCALHDLHDGTQCDPSRKSDRSAVAGNLAGLLKEAGWPYHQRPGGELLADLETGGEFFQAGVEPCSAGARFRVTLHRDDGASEVSRQALCLYLLEANAALRYARAFFERDGDAAETGFEVCAGSTPAAEEAGHALSALSVAARMCAGEIKVLGGSVAGIYRSARPPFFQRNLLHQNQGA